MLLEVADALPALVLVAICGSSSSCWDCWERMACTSPSANHLTADHGPQ